MRKDFQTNPRNGLFGNEVSVGQFGDDPLNAWSVGGLRSGFHAQIITSFMYYLKEEMRILRDRGSNRELRRYNLVVLIINDLFTEKALSDTGTMPDYLVRLVCIL